MPWTLPPVAATSEREGVVRSPLLSDDHAIAGEVASSAGQILLELRREMAGAPSHELAAAADRRSHEEIVAALATHYPRDVVLSEEGSDDDARLSAPRVWIVDPLDGTREFGEGRSDWAVHVALVVDGELSVGAVALPGLGRTLVSGNPCDVRPRQDGPIRIAVSRSRPPSFAVALQADLRANLVEMGSAGAKAMAVVSGEVDIYAHAGGQHEWDSAAPAAVAASAGLHVSRIDGSSLRYNQPDPWLPDLLICRPDLAARVIQVVRAGGRG